MFAVRRQRAAATALWIDWPDFQVNDPKRRRRFIVPAHSKPNLC